MIMKKLLEKKLNVELALLTGLIEQYRRQRYRWE